MSASGSVTEDSVRRWETVKAELEAQWLKQIEGAAPPPFADLVRSVTASLLADQDRLELLQARYYEAQLALWREMLGQTPVACEAPEHHPDPRFSAAEWRDIPWFDFLRRSYALNTRYLHDLLQTVPGDETARRKLRFYAKQYADAAAPSNFVVTNPEVIKLALATQGESLAQGMRNLQADARKGRVSMSDESAFEVGRNIALTPGAVIYRNDLIELIQYRPATDTVYSRPLVIVPPFINKYYILDLQPENSFVRYAVERGFTVFIVSWRNVSPALGTLTWDDYIERGALSAIDTARAVTKRAHVNALGFCVGGTLLASALAVLARKGQRPIAALTLLASMLDFSDPGDISVYVDDSYAHQCDRELGRGGVFAGSRLASAFASLRANDLVWRYVVNNYLKGRTPPAFDLLYWNADSANLPGPLYAYYVRHMYLENALRDPGRLTMCGVPVDLGTIEVPTYVLATAEDHIVPWRTAYASAQLLGARVGFVRASSGHIAGVIAPPQQRRRSFRSGAMKATPDAWLNASFEHAGSWWPHWADWLAHRSGRRIRARARLGNENAPELQAAPGSYVRERPG